MYSHHLLFSDDRRAFEEGRFWFQDGLHYPEPLRPFDAATVEWAVVALNQAHARRSSYRPAPERRERGAQGVAPSSWPSEWTNAYVRLHAVSGLAGA
jgi:hypothetical protein